MAAGSKGIGLERFLYSLIALVELNLAVMAILLDVMIFDLLTDYAEHESSSTAHHIHFERASLI